MTKRPRHKHAQKSTPTATTALSSAHGPRGWLAAAVAMLLVARPLVPSEEVRSLADGQLFVMLWLVIGLLWLGFCVKSAVPRRSFSLIDGLVGLLVLAHVVS